MGGLTFSVEHRLRVLENWVLSRTFGPNRDEVTGKWKKLHNENRYELYSSTNINQVIKMRWKLYVAYMVHWRDT